MYDKIINDFNAAICDMQEKENERRYKEYMADIEREENNIKTAAQLIKENNNDLLKPIINYMNSLTDEQLKELTKYEINYFVDVFLNYKDLLK